MKFHLVYSLYSMQTTGSLSVCLERLNPEILVPDSNFSDGFENPNPGLLGCPLLNKILRL